MPATTVRLTHAVEPGAGDPVAALVPERVGRQQLRVTGRFELHIAVQIGVGLGVGGGEEQRGSKSAEGRPALVLPCSQDYARTFGGNAAWIPAMVWPLTAGDGREHVGGRGLGQQDGAPLRSADVVGTDLAQLRLVPCAADAGSGSDAAGQSGGGGGGGKGGGGKGGALDGPSGLK